MKQVTKRKKSLKNFTEVSGGYNTSVITVDEKFKSHTVDEKFKSHKHLEKNNLACPNRTSIRAGRGVK
jgi:hypothetical protein